ncbi:hypothetical protein DVH24_032603 [Malus domestica]|uniref:Uncharacterized protein n=1 Tax=Malus domestica TaxID=3750 RepID=A0A498J4X2_MALDO|nr:hypothetical protein DVH24_032603 [Malus domestica]
MEISNDVKRDEVERLVTELMDGEKGKKMKNKVMVWKKLAKEATGPHGSSSKNLDMLVNQVLLRKTRRHPMGDPLGSSRVSSQKQYREGVVEAQSEQYRATMKSSPGCGGAQVGM